MGTVHAVNFAAHVRPGRGRKWTDEIRESSRRHRAPVSQSAVEALKKRLAKATDEDGRRSYAMLLVLLATGMRASELVILQVSDFRKDDQGPMVSFRRPKRKDRHVIRLLGKTFRKVTKAIQAYHEVAGITGEDHVFWSRQIRRAGEKTYTKHTKLVTRSLQRIVNGWGIKDGMGKIVAPHAFRHLIGRKMESERNHIYAQKLLGHSDPKTTSDFYTDHSVTGPEV